MPRGTAIIDYLDEDIEIIKFKEILFITMGYVIKLESKLYKFGGEEFRIFKPRKRGGTSYQYTGNPHLAKVESRQKVPYPESPKHNPWRMENSYQGPFQKLNPVTGRFLEGWFGHSDDGTMSTKEILKKQGK